MNSSSLAVDLYKCVLRIRLVEEALADRYSEQEMRCPMHLCIGQEAIAAGVCSALRKDDMAFSNHRAHGHYLAKGGNLNRLIAEIYCRSTGCAGGRGGSMHLIDLDVGFIGSTPIVGGTVPLAVGAAWSAKMNKSSKVAVTFLGDGCFEEGVVHECLNFAALKKLPVIFVCENNGYSVYTPLSERQPDRPIHAIAQAHGWNSKSGDGLNVTEVASMSGEAVKNAREGRGPQFLEFSTQRWREHCGPNYDLELGYRSEAELDIMKDQCTVKNQEAYLLEKGLIDPKQVQRIQKEIEEEINAAFRFAKASPFPDKSTLTLFSNSHESRPS